MAAKPFHIPLVGEEADDPCIDILTPQSRSLQVEAADTDARDQAHKASGRIKFALALAAVGLMVCAGAFSLDRSATKGVRGTTAIQQLNAKATKNEQSEVEKLREEVEFLRQKLEQVAAPAANAPTPAAARPTEAPAVVQDQEAPEKDGPYVVVAVYSGRVERMRLLLPYLNRLRDNGEIDEIHIWDFCKYAKDRAWILMTAWQNGYKIQNYMGGRVLGRVYDYYAKFERPAGKGDGPMVILKVDDDIVYIDMDSFGNFTRFVANTPDMLLVHANVVNNGVAAFYQFQQPALQDSPLAAPLEVYPEDPDEGDGGVLVKPNPFVAQLHEKFLEDPTAFRWGDSNSCIEFHKPDSAIQGQGRFSINFYGARREVWPTLAKFVNDLKGDDEPAVTNVATANNYKECMYTSFNVVHTSFGLQFEAAVYGPRYEQLLEQQGLHALPGLNLNDPCSAKEGDHSTDLEALRADHVGDDLPDMPLKGLAFPECKAVCNAKADCKGVAFVFEVDAVPECHLKGNATADAVTDPYHCLWVKPTSRL